MSNLSPASVLYDSSGTEKGTSGNPVRVDPTGTTTQPVSVVDGANALDVNASGQAAIQNPPNLDVAASTLATEATAATLLTEADFDTRVGEVQATPTANTVLGRLKDITDTLQGAGGLANAVRITDGVDGPVAVIGANASPVPSDFSLVVQISPNQDPIPTTVVPATANAGSMVGRVSGLSANSYTAVRQTIYVEQTTNAQRSLVSTNANDSAAGTGARSVTLTYYDQSLNGPFTEIITLNGTTPVDTVATDICFIERIVVKTAGSNGSNVGTLNLYTTTGGGGSIFAAVGVGALASGLGDNRTFYAHHYVAPGVKVVGYSVTTGISSSSTSSAVSVTNLSVRNPTATDSPYLVVTDLINSVAGNSVQRQYLATPEILGPSVIVAFVLAQNNNSTAYASFDFSEEPI